ncbi:MAG TPA: diaminopimelate decarboxylase, partial [Rhodopila sp.]|nr:diaminopimelate decarboxylase [Rhodopila sp.]
MATHPVAHNPATDPMIADLIAARPWLRYDALDGLLLDDVPLAAIAGSAGTPTWVYSAATLRDRYAMLIRAMTDAGLDMQVHFAVKANDSRSILSLFARQGAGADVVSGGELRKARHAGIPADRIVYSGVGKSAAELRLALEEGIGQVNVESAEELAMLSAIAMQLNRTACVALRVNPD